MANGDLLVLDRHRWSQVMLDAQSASDNGVWVELPPGYSQRSFQADAIESGASIQIMVSNAISKPANSTDGVISSTLSGTTLGAALEEAFRWVKCKKTAGGTPAASTVILEAGRND